MSSSFKGIGYELDVEAASDYIHDGYLLAPRTVFKGRIKNPYVLSHPGVGDLEHVTARIEQTIRDLVGEVKGKQRAVMFTGGFDSSFVALLAKQRGAEVTAITVQFDQYNGATVRDAVESAKKLGIAYQVLTVSTAEFVAAFDALTGLTDEPILSLELAVTYAALQKYDRKAAGRVILSGMGCDHWYGNIALEERPGGFPAKVEWAVTDAEAHQRVAESFGCRFIFPFLAKPMLELSLAVSDEFKRNKKLLRALALVSDLPARGAKTALQIPDVVKRILIRVYGNHAWPQPLPVRSYAGDAQDRALRKIILGLWVEKARNRSGIYKRKTVSKRSLIAR